MKKLNKDVFIERAKIKHNNTYDYSKVEYEHSKQKVCIICPVHGEFWQRPNDHLSGYGCPKCNNEYKPTTEEWVERAKEVHGNKYDYSKVEYINANTKVCIICPIHGEFWQSPLNHYFNKCGCPKCNSNKKSVLENNLSLLLDSKDVVYEREKTFDWLRHRSFLRLDFYLPQYNVAIECQGEQHYRPIAKFGGKEAFEEIQTRDEVKRKLCIKHGIKIFFINRRNKNIDEILNFINETTNKETKECC